MRWYKDIFTATGEPRVDAWQAVDLIVLAALFAMVAAFLFGAFQ